MAVTKNMLIMFLAEKCFWCTKDLLSEVPFLSLVGRGNKMPVTGPLGESERNDFLIDNQKLANQNIILHAQTLNLNIQIQGHT